MKSTQTRTSFKKDLKRIRKRGLDRGQLDAVIDLLCRGLPLPAARRDHPLKGEWEGWRECQIEPDWLLIYKITDDEVLLARTGTHADLF